MRRTRRRSTSTAQLQPDTPTLYQLSVDQFFSPGPFPFSPGTVALPEGTWSAEAIRANRAILDSESWHNTPARRRQYSTARRPCDTGVSRKPAIPTSARLYDQARSSIRRAPDSIQPRNADGADGATKAFAEGADRMELRLTRVTTSTRRPTSLPIPLPWSLRMRTITTAGLRVRRRWPQGRRRRRWARPCSGICRWAATRSRPAARATSTPAPTTGPRTRPTPTTSERDLTLQLHGGVQNTNLVATDFPFQKVQDTSNGPGNGFGNVNDVASSMGVRFRRFVDIPTPERWRSVRPTRLV